MQVASVLAKKLARARETGRALGPECVAILRPSLMNGLRAGAPVYVDGRWMWLPLVFAAISFFWIGAGVAAHGVAVAALTFALTFLAYDLYSGILHLCLDHPDNIAVPRKKCETHIRSSPPATLPSCRPQRAAARYLGNAESSTSCVH